MATKLAAMFVCTNCGDLLTGITHIKLPGPK